ncbi:MAG: gliding motility-associated C-terminal domain-containing protein, partial [Candidatus Cyclobacteriaceae bacterium M3_2C_046]
INGQLSTNPEDQLIAHVGQECRGRARVVFEPGREVGLVFLLVRSNATNGETISFSVKPAGSTNEILTSTTLEFISDGSYGSISDPIQFITDPNRVDLGEFKAFKYFTPNGDGYHDTWEIQDVGKYQAFTLTIVNDHGKMVFQTDNYENDWDGTSQGKALPVGAYYYILQSAVRPEVYKGSISILK